MRHQGITRRSVLALGLAPLAPLSLAHPAAAAPAGSPAFRNPRLTRAARVEDLLGRLTTQEKISLLHQYQPAIPRLGIAAFRTGTEALHGVAWLGEATVFPQAVGMASTWHPELIRRVGEAVGTEARGFQQERPEGWSLNLWAPVANLLRDPRWGRNEEGYSEDPHLTAAIATAYGRGMRGEDPDHLRTAPTLKHFLAYNNEVHRSTTSSSVRPRVRAEYDEAAFRPVIEAGAVTGVMASYNLVNGRPATVNPDLGGRVRSWTKETLLHVTDAGAPNNLLPGNEDYYPDRTAGDAATLRAGNDSFTVDDADPSHTVAALTSALQQGLIDAEDIDRAARHILDVRFRLGEFDPDGGPYSGITRAAVDSPAHRALARECAGEAVVLLKNDHATLPLDARTTRSVAVVGPLGDTLYTDWYSGTPPYTVTVRDGVREALGDGATVPFSEGVDRVAFQEADSGRHLAAGPGDSGDLLHESTEDPGEAGHFDVFDWGAGVVTLRAVANGRVLGYDGEHFRNDQTQPNGWFVQQLFSLVARDDGTHLLRYVGYDKTDDPHTYLAAGADGTLHLTDADTAGRYRVRTVRDGVAEAVAAATGADAAVVVVGSMPFVNGREDHDRPDLALAPAQAALVQAVRRANPRTVMVLQTSYPDAVTQQQATLPALLWTTHAGQETGHAVADVLFGDRNPAGRLTQTWYRSEDDLPGILDYDIIKSRRTYWYFTGEPLYPFGHGLSYTTFRYGPCRLRAAAIASGDTVVAEVDVTNTGDRDGDEVVQLYTRHLDSRDPQPRRRLRAFTRVHLRAGATRTVRLTLPAGDLAHWDVTRGRPVLEDGHHEVMVGASSADIRATARLRVHGERIPARDLSRPTRAADFDDHHGAALVDETKTRGESVALGEGCWLSYDDADLSEGPRTLTVRYTREAEGDCRLQVRLDRPDGPTAADVVLPSTGDRYRHRTVRARLEGARGRRAVYLLLTGDARLSTFSLH
ncbi:glycoside hydrolase family 3 C-terminal domain-containing protein [Streptomyces sp. NPDC059740]|uniref:glycoside hydrolase family 3 C-terminal domain-containing protein n=1 Tax=Streptomyces sp. NPDC059740 TaxID=3346926 RepID=UPI0036491864